MQRLLSVVLTVVVMCCFAAPVRAGDSASIPEPQVSIAKLTPEAVMILGDGDAVPLVLAQSAPGESGEESYDFDDGFDDGFEETAPLEVNDPFEGWNRFWFAFNDGFYFGILKPVATGYKAITTPKVRRGVKNFFHNLLFPVRFAGNILQGKFKHAGVEFGRFFINTTVGIAGFDDQAKSRKAVVDIEDDEDFGQTLGVWGFGEGAYLVWPLLGPSSIRDTVGFAGDYFLNPLTYVNPWYVGGGARVIDVTNKTSMNLGEYESLKEASVDPYVALREIYIKVRRNRLTK